MAGESATAEDVAYIRELYGFDRPFLVRYFAWASRAVTGDFGYSYYLRPDVSSIIFAHLPVTMTLGACALGFALLPALPLGVLAAMRPNSIIDRFALTLAVVGRPLSRSRVSLLLSL